ncbi:carbohydrate ABC transporter permease [Paenibacillaceae bacterium WGS1546]|uniref:carbohydrate ABC transporter permease n=1 Tax=Cohnella sp. WGS1546 TaxID=3366810 RepID=UPI00372D0FC7
MDNFASIFNDRHFSLALKNTLLFAFLTTLIKMVAGLFLALALHRSLKTRHILRTVFYLPGVLSMVVIGILFSALLRMDGMINEWLNWIGFGGAEIDWLGNPKIAMFSIIASEVWRWSGFVMTVFLAGLQGIPKDYYEAATIDGAGAKRRFLHITLPLLAPAFTVNLTMCIIGGFKVFEQVLVLTNGGPGYATQVLNTIIYQTFSEGWLAKSTAMELVLFAFIVVLTLIVSSLSRRREVEM